MCVFVVNGVVKDMIGRRSLCLIPSIPSCLVNGLRIVDAWNY